MRFPRTYPLVLLTALLAPGLWLGAGPAAAQPAGNTGIGALLGNPSGLSFKFYPGSGRAYDLLLAWDSDYFLAQGHVLLTEAPLGDAGEAYYFIGPGLFAGFRDRNNDRDDNEDVDIGLSGNFGIGYFIDRFELFAQITPRLALVPGTDGAVGGGVGLRFYFDPDPRFPSRPMTRPIRVLIAKIGLDGHDRGARLIAAALRDAGMEVIYTGLRRTPEMVVAAALEEDVDVIGASSLSGAHMTIFPRLKRLMEAEGLDEVVLLGGGILPAEDIAALTALGVDKVFTPGTPLGEIVSYIQAAVAQRAGE